ncbi:hypothetical protein BC936DRAFT_140278, partial [Jimgerdemannia flammicorona]
SESDLESEDDDDCIEVDERAHIDDDDIKIGIGIDDFEIVSDEVCVGDGVRVGDEVRVSDGVRVDDEVRVGDGVRIDDEVHVGDEICVDDGVRVGDEIRVDDGVRVGDEVRIDDEVHVDDEVRVGDGVHVGDGMGVKRIKIEITKIQNGIQILIESISASIDKGFDQLPREYHSEIVELIEDVAKYTLQYGEALPIRKRHHIRFDVPDTPPLGKRSKRLPTTGYTMLFQTVTVALVSCGSGV